MTATDQGAHGAWALAPVTDTGTGDRMEILIDTVEASERCLTLEHRANGASTPILQSAITGFHRPEANSSLIIIFLTGGKNLHVQAETLALAALVETLLCETIYDIALSKSF